MGITSQNHLGLGIKTIPSIKHESYTIQTSHQTSSTSLPGLLPFVVHQIMPQTACFFSRFLVHQIVLQCVLLFAIYSRCIVRQIVLYGLNYVESLCSCFLFYSCSENEKRAVKPKTGRFVLFSSSELRPGSGRS